MKLIVGLGNPGEKYQHTRHNAGFMALDILAKKTGGKWDEDTSMRTLTSQINGEKITLLKPQSFMNLSGKEIKKAMDKENISTEDLIVVYDDIDIPFSEIRVRKGGGTAGHNGINSIVEETGSDNFIRVRIGISPTSPNLSPLPTADFVLEDFTSEEKEKLEEVIEEAMTKIYQIVKFGYEQYISKYNTKSTNESSPPEA